MIYPAEVEEGREFFDRVWPAARAVADPVGGLFDHFDVSRAGIRQLFGPSVWGRLREVRGKGYRHRFPIGNPWLLSGMFLVQDGRILWQYRYRHIGDHPDLSEVLSQSVNDS